MKQTITFLFLIIAFHAAAQIPKTLTYQSVIRNSNNELIVNQEVGVNLSILYGSTTGNSVYSESKQLITNSNGLITVEFGNNENFNAINWANGPYFLKAEIDLSGGNNYTVTQVNQLLRVPYALRTAFAESITGDFQESDPVFTIWDKSAGITINENQISDLGEYLTDESDPIFTAWDKSTGISITESQITDLQDYLISEVDPTYAAYFNASSPSEGDLLRFNASSGKWEAYSPSFADSEHTHELATTTESGFMGNTDKEKLDGVESGAQVNVNPDWNSTSGDSEILNKPSLGHLTLNANTLTINNVGEPVEAQDAATKAYVDELGQLIADVKLAMNVAQDIDGNVYDIVTIGNQQWFASNLKTTRYNNGVNIEFPENATDWESAGNSSIGSYTWYEGNEEFGEIYGAYYNWFAVNAGNLCPVGWHVPSETEWNTLETYLIENGFNYDGTTTGDKVAKSLASTTEWHGSTNEGAVGNTDYQEVRNITGFTAYPAGYVGSNGSYCEFGESSAFWGSNEASTLDGVMSAMTYYRWDLTVSSLTKKDGLSVRCIKD